MGSFLNYLDDMEKDFNVIDEKEKYIDEIDESDVYDDDDVNNKSQENVVNTHTIKSNDVYKKRLITELSEIGLNKKKINELVYNIFSDNVYEDNDDVVEDYIFDSLTNYQQPRIGQSSFKQKMQQRKKLVAKTETMAEHASGLLGDVPGGYDGYTPTQTIQPQIPAPQQQYTMPQQQQQYYTPPSVPTGSMMEVNNGSGGEITPVMASTPKSLLTMPEGFENYKPDADMNVSMHDAVNIFGEPRGEHVGQGVVMPQQIAMPTAPPISQQINPQQAQDILIEPGREHFENSNKITNHASQLL